MPRRLQRLSDTVAKGLGQVLAKLRGDPQVALGMKDIKGWTSADVKRAFRKLARGLLLKLPRLRPLLPMPRARVLSSRGVPVN